MAEITFVPLLHDLAFKEILANEENRDILEYFWETFLELESGSLHHKLEVMYESVIAKMEFKEKNMRGDIMVKFDNVLINIEVYTRFSEAALIKSISYLCREFSKYNIGDLYSKRSVWQINIVGRTYISISNILFNSFSLMSDIVPNERLFDGNFKTIIVRVDSDETDGYNVSDEMRRWKNFIKANSREERHRAAENDELLLRLDRWIDVYMSDEKAKQIYEEWGMQIARENALLEATEKGVEQKAKEAAIEMLKLDMPFDVIAKVTKLDAAIIMELKGMLQDKDKITEG